MVLNKFKLIKIRLGISSYKTNKQKTNIKTNIKKIIMCMNSYRT